VVRLSLGAVITFCVGIQTAHSAGQAIGPWAIFGATILALKDAQSYISQSWAQAFHASLPPNS